MNFDILRFIESMMELDQKNQQIKALKLSAREAISNLGHQKSLYDSVKTDRSLYSKNLNETREEVIVELITSHIP